MGNKTYYTLRHKTYYTRCIPLQNHLSRRLAILKAAASWEKTEVRLDAVGCRLFV